MNTDVTALEALWEIDLSAEDMTAETLDDTMALGTTGSFACGACASCPVGCASSAGTFSSAG
ncbi:thiocillin family RiPP [Krasilnikovia sp. MM14-A1259]|uniref:thiocillin family RiPP n=1 Tax=Krasilnikovia sp. MM14-A1259 TaxID=3373539 RepID=UPI00380C2B86